MATWMSETAPSVIYPTGVTGGGVHSLLTTSFGTYVRNVSANGLPSADGSEFRLRNSRHWFRPDADLERAIALLLQRRVIVQVVALEGVRHHAIVGDADEDDRPVHVDDALWQAVDGKWIAQDLPPSSGCSFASRPPKTERKNACRMASTLTMGMPQIAASTARRSTVRALSSSAVNSVGGSSVAIGADVEPGLHLLEVR